MHINQNYNEKNVINYTLSIEATLRLNKKVRLQNERLQKLQNS